MSCEEHIQQAEMLLKETAESPTSAPEERLVWATAALAHLQFGIQEHLLMIDETLRDIQKTLADMVEQ